MSNRKDIKVVLLVSAIICIFCSTIALPLLKKYSASIDSYDKDYQQTSCTIFSFSDEKGAYFCNNEDFFPRHYRMYFLPAEGGKNGMMLYGFSLFHGLNVLGGMNEHGLSADENWVPPTSVKIHPDRIDFRSNGFFSKILENCSTVVEAIEFTKKYNLVMMRGASPHQFHLADAGGDAVVVSVDDAGETHFSRKKGRYLLSTNFNLAQKPRSCWRYELADSALKSLDSFSIPEVVRILKNTNQYRHGEVNNNDPLNGVLFTRYSSINDMKNKTIRFFIPPDYRHSAVVDLQAELKKGAHSYDIQSFVRSQSGSYMPASSIWWITLFTILPIALVSGIWKLNKHRIVASKWVFFGAIITLIFATAFGKLSYSINNNDAYNTIAHINIASIFIFLIGIWFTPMEALAVCVSGTVLGELMGGIIFGAGDELPLYLVAVASAHGFGGFLISYLKRKLRYTVLAMLLGGIWQYIAMAGCMYVWYEIINNISSFSSPIIPLGLSIYAIATDILLIPVALLLSFLLSWLNFGNVVHGVIASPSSDPTAP